MYFEKSGTLVLLLSPLKGEEKVDEEPRTAGVELMVRTVVACFMADRARARDMVERGAIASTLAFVVAQLTQAGA